MPKRAAPRPRAVPAVLLCAALLAACGGGGAAVTTPREEPAFAALRIDPLAASVPVGGTVQLSGVPVDGSGSILAGLPAPAYTSSDEARATVGPSGLVTGRAAGGVTITATLTADGVTRTATAAVTVTAPAAPPAPGGPAPGSATVDAGDHAFSPSTVTIAPGGTVTWRMVDDEHDVTFDGPAPTGGNVPKTDEGKSVSRVFPAPGTYSYRCARHESKGKTGKVVVTGDAAPPATPPPPAASATVTTPGTSFSPAEVTVRAGATVQWDISGATHNVTFGSAAPPGGSIPDTRPGSSATRTFPTAGSYPYTCTRHDGMTGRVVVQ